MDKQIYYYNEEARTWGGRSVTRHFGLIVEREVDKFNGAIKVFQPIAYRHSGYDLHLHNTSNNNWDHLSGLTIKPASKKEVNLITSEIKGMITEAKGEVLTLVRLYERIGGLE